MAFCENGYITKQISRALNPRQQQVSPPAEYSTSAAFLPFNQNTLSHISGMLTNHYIRMVVFASRKVANFLHP
jgi:hypothetical protein